MEVLRPTDPLGQYHNQRYNKYTQSDIYMFYQIPQLVSVFIYYLHSQIVIQNLNAFVR